MILNSNESHPVNPWLERWIKANQAEHDIRLVRQVSELDRGDILFLISCTEIVTQAYRDQFVKTLVVHASDLPKGRGWSPHVWEILKGAETITVSLLEAEEKVDSGSLWHKINVDIPKSALYDEINQIIFDVELQLMTFAVENFSTIEPVQQNDTGATYWPQRSPEDSELDIHKSIEEQFNLLRVCDPQRFPAYFYLEGRKFKILIEADDD